MAITLEQRKHQRVPVDVPGIFSAATVHGEDSVVQDLSEEGCRMGSAFTVAIDSTIHLQIRPHQAAPIYVPSAIVRWVRGSTFGVQFKELAGYESKALARLLWSLSPPKEGVLPAPHSET